MSMAEYRKLQEKLKSEVDSKPKSEFSSQYYSPFSSMKENDVALIRFLPDKNSNNPRQWYVEKVQHRFEINGEVKYSPCLWSYDKTPCPICQLSQKFYKEEGKDSKHGLELYKKINYIVQVLVIKDPTSNDSGESREGKVFLMNLSKQLFNFIQAQFDNFDDDDDVPWSIDGGFDFSLKKTVNAGRNSYIIGSAFKNRSRALTEDEIQAVEDSGYDLSTIIPSKPETVDLEKMASQYLSGDFSDDDSSDYDFNKRDNEPSHVESNDAVAKAKALMEKLNRNRETTD